MKSILAWLLFAAPLIVPAQENKGIYFENGSWDDIKLIAKTTNRFIFADLYASWCSPCRVMDKEIYTLDSVGTYFNEHYVSFKIQMDKTRNDDEIVRSRYGLAETFSKQYNVDAYPSFLFFSPDGDVIHKAIGFQDAAAFLQTAREALNPSKQYFALMEKYNKDQSDPELLKKLAIAAKKTGNESFALKLADAYLEKVDSTRLYTTANFDFIKQFNASEKVRSIAASYKTHVLDNLDHTALFKKENFDFLFAFPQLINSRDGFFYYFYHFPKQTDSLLNREVSERWVKFTVNKEEVTAKLYDSNKNPLSINPDWKSIEHIISSKYSAKYARALIPDAQFDFYRRIEDWDKYVGMIEAKIKANPPKEDSQALSPFGDAFALNNWAFDLFQHCDSRKNLKKALQWVETAIRLDTSSLAYVSDYDTKANILYKLGMKNEAISLQQTAVITDLENKDKQGEERKPLTENDFYITLNKMKNGEPTWVKKEDAASARRHFFLTLPLFCLRAEK